MAEDEPQTYAGWIGVSLILISIAIFSASFASYLGLTTFQLTATGCVLVVAGIVFFGVEFYLTGEISEDSVDASDPYVDDWERENL